jgi:hypothetical protein
MPKPNLRILIPSPLLFPIDKLLQEIHQDLAAINVSKNESEIQSSATVMKSARTELESR